MHISRKIDKALQWATEQIGMQDRTFHSDEFKQMEYEMAVRYEGMERLHKSMTSFVKWLSRKTDAIDEAQMLSSTSYLGRAMLLHGEDFDTDSHFGKCLISLGRANKACGGLQEIYAESATNSWLECTDRSLVIMREYQASRKKLESRRIGFDASTSKMNRPRRDQFRAEEELRTAKAKFEESQDDVVRRMMDIKESENEYLRNMSSLLDAQIEYHERCSEELRQARSAWVRNDPAARPISCIRPRANTASVALYDNDKDSSAGCNTNTPFQDFSAGCITNTPFNDFSAGCISNTPFGDPIEEQILASPVHILIRGLVKPASDPPVKSWEATLGGMPTIVSQGDGAVKASAVVLRTRPSRTAAQTPDVIGGVPKLKTCPAE